MKKKSKVLLGIAGACLVLISSGVIWQWQNIKAVREASRYSKEELAVQIDEQKSKVEDILKDYGVEDAVDFTFEEEEAIRKGEMTLEEALEKLEQRKEEKKAAMAAGAQTNEAEKPDKAENVSEAGNSDEVKKPEGASGQDKSRQAVEAAVSEMYVLKAKYIGKLGALERAARSEYNALPENEKRGSGAKKLLAKYTDLGLSTESQCDGEVSAILNRLKSQLQEMNASTEIVSTMKASYDQEKTLKKAYYLNMIK